MEIKFTPEAHNDISAIYGYVEKDGESIAKEQVINIYDGIEKLGSFPQMGTALQKLVNRQTTLRYLVIRKVYIVIYDVTGFVEIIRVFRKDQDFISVLGIGNEE